MYSVYPPSVIRYLQIIMKLNRLRFCEEADLRLRHLKARTKLTPNLLCRIGFCLSLADPTFAEPSNYPEDSKREIARYTLTGQYDALFVALLRERCYQDGLLTTDALFAEQFRAHMNRGVLLLYHRVKSLVDLCKLVAQLPALSALPLPKSDPLTLSPIHHLSNSPSLQPSISPSYQPSTPATHYLSNPPAPYLTNPPAQQPISPPSHEPIYMDHHATTPVDKRVLEQMWPFFSVEFGNAASKDHELGIRANQAVEKAREQIAHLINGKPEEIILTSGATESNNIALFGIASAYAHQGTHIITCVTEHKAILDPAHLLERRDMQITYLPVDQYGCIDLADLRQSITPQTILISIMAANNEIGTLAPLAEIGKIAREHDLIFHTDATQAVGHIPIDVQAMNIHLLSLSAHKMYGPKGIGALYVRRSNPGIKLTPLIYGGGHERGLRSGTLNVPNIVGFGAAAAIAKREMPQLAAQSKRWTEQLWHALQERIPPIELNGHPTQRLPHNLNLYIPGIESRSFIVGMEELAISTGSACTTAKVEPSHVIQALGFGEERAHASLRIGVGRSNSDQQVERAIEIIAQRVNQLRSLSPVPL